MFALHAFVGSAPAAQAETRSLKLMFIHTGEKAEITFKRNGKYDQQGLAKLNQFLRDWRRNEPTKMDPRLFDLVWEAYRATGSDNYINVVSAYRSPATNSMLRSRSKGVAEKSQHMLGKAMDFFIPGVPLKKLREIGLKMQGGGVGYYPTSGSPFVHFDVGNVRHWPRMSRQELVAVFPQGKTLHVPSDGKPLPGFEQALAAYEARKKSGATALALATSGGGSRSGGLLSAIFGGGADEEEESGGQIAADEPAPKARPAKPAKPEAETTNGGKIRILPPELARPAELPPLEEPQREVIVAALPTRDVPLPSVAPRPSRDVGAPIVDLNDSRAPLVDLIREQVPPPPEQAAAQVALGIPIPTRRPDYPPADAAVQAAEPVVVASAEPAEMLATATTRAVPVPALRPAAAEKVFAEAALPKKVKAIPQLAAYAVDESNAFPAAPEEVIASPKGTPVASGTPASLRAALAESGADPESVIGAGPRTTPKAARPAAKDSKPDRKPLVVAAQPHAARWAFDAEYLANNTRGTTAPSYAYQIVTTAPREVYTAGFQQEDQAALANRFSGKAVTFLSVARFN